jgi:tRNA-dihydrouridine synthase A
LAECARIAAAFGYDEINLNVGCPSDRVQSGNFGACLMREPERVAKCVALMRDAVDLPITVKHRIGVDELDSYEHMLHFVDIVAAAGCDRFSVHARKAWLSGLSPKQNRTIPPLRHHEVYRLKRERPELPIEINGGVRSLGEIAEHLEHVDAVMIGRAAWDDPWLFADVDRRFFGDRSAAPPEWRPEGSQEGRGAPRNAKHFGGGVPAPSRNPYRSEVVGAYLEYAERWLAAATPRGPSSSILMRPLHNLFVGQPNARRWKQAVNEKCQRPRGLEQLLELARELEAGATLATAAV